MQTYCQVCCHSADLSVPIETAVLSAEAGADSTLAAWCSNVMVSCAQVELDGFVIGSAKIACKVKSDLSPEERGAHQNHGLPCQAAHRGVFTTFSCRALTFNAVAPFACLLVSRRLGTPRDYSLDPPLWLGPPWEAPSRPSLVASGPSRSLKISLKLPFNLVLLDPREPSDPSLPSTLPYYSRPSPVTSGPFRNPLLHYFSSHMWCLIRFFNFALFFHVAGRTQPCTGPSARHSSRGS